MRYLPLILVVVAIILVLSLIAIVGPFTTLSGGTLSL